MKKLIMIGLALTVAASVFAADPKYKADVPASLITPETVKTKYLGDLKFVDGFPTDATLEKFPSPKGVSLTKFQ